MEKEYLIYLNSIKIGTTKLENADAPMGVVFGKIYFNEIVSPFSFIKNYCHQNNITINEYDSELEFIDTQVIKELKVFRKDGVEIKGVAGNAITGMSEDGYEIQILGISYPFYKEEFPHHVKAYNDMYESDK